MLDSFYFLIAALGGSIAGTIFGIFGMYQYCIRRIIQCQNDIRQTLK